MAGQMIYVCSWHPGGPIVIRVVEDSRVPDGVTRTSHGMCPECAKRVEDEWRKKREGERK